MPKNFPHPHPQSYLNILLLKQLHYSHPPSHIPYPDHTPHQCPIKQQLLNFKHRLPLEFQKAILEYFYCCGRVEGGYGVLEDAAGIWRRLGKDFGEKIFGEFQELVGRVGEMGQEQADVCRYNLACLYQRNGHNIKAYKILQQITHQSTETQLLTLKLHLKSHTSFPTSTSTRFLTPLLTHYKSLTQTPPNKSYLQTLNKCELYQIYNIALCLKKGQQFGKAILLFDKVVEEIEAGMGRQMGLGNRWQREGRIWVLAHINLAECWFSKGDTKHSTTILYSVLSLQNHHVQPYKPQLCQKLQCWTKSTKILELAIKFGQNYHSDALKLLNNQPIRNKQSTNLFRTRKLCVLEDMGLELDMLATKHNKRLKEGKRERSQDVVSGIYSRTRENVTSIQTTRSKRSNLNLNLKTNHKFNSNQARPQTPSNLQIPSIIHTHTSQKVTFANPNPNSYLPNKIPQNLTSLLTSKLQSSNVSNRAAFSSSMISSESSIGQNQNEINHYWAAIKNGQERERIRESSYGQGSGEGKEWEKEKERELTEKIMNLGDVYVKVHDFGKAEAVYKKALERGRYDAYGRLGDIYYQKNKTIAIEYYQKRLKNLPETDAKTTLKLLHCYSKCPQHHKKAAEKLKELLQQNPDNLQAHILLASIYVKQDHVDRAIQICEQFRQRKFLCEGNQYFLGLVYKMADRGKEAYDCFINVLRINPAHTASLIQLTELTYLPDFYLQLTTIYKKALSINPHQLHSVPSPSHQHQHQQPPQKNHEIIQILKHLIQKTQIEFENLKPKLVFSELIALGDFFLEKEMVEEAEYCYREAGQYTSNSLLKEKLGNLEYFKDNFAQAEKYYKQSQKRKPHLKIHLKLADSLIKQQKYQQAYFLLQQYLLKQSKNKSTCLNMLGQCQFELGKYEQALQRFKLSSQLGYSRRVNFTWEKACRRKIMEEMRNQAMAK